MGDELQGAATAILDAADMALVADLGARRRIDAGEYLYRAGDLTYDFFVLVSAEVDIVLSVDDGERIIVHHGPGRFLGEVNMLSGLRVLVSARVVKAGEVIVVARDRLRRLMAADPRLGDTILTAFVARRSILLTSAAPAIRVIGSRFSPESLAVREFLARTRVPHEWLDPDRDPQVEDLLLAFGIAPAELPVMITLTRVSAITNFPSQPRRTQLLRPVDRVFGSRAAVPAMTAPGTDELAGSPIPDDCQTPDDGTARCRRGSHRPKRAAHRGHRH